MAIRQSLKTAGQGTVVVVVAMAANGCATGSARTDYLVARNTTHKATQGDGSLVEFAPDGPNATWSASLTFVPILNAGDLADTR